MERRRSRRHILCIDTQIDVGADGLLAGRLLDISGVGAYVVIDAIVPTRRLARLSFEADGDNARRCHAFGRVVRCVFGDNDTGVGITFTEHDAGFSHWMATLDDVTESGRTRIAKLLRDIQLRLR